MLKTTSLKKLVVFHKMRVRKLLKTSSPNLFFKNRTKLTLSQSFIIQLYFL